ncbi:ectoine synthase [Parvibaculum sp.]|uniref:ectoine synthase n=1 Tax=Parvibaculum sp. TaxID=2024848 RepID=UPI002C49BB95|nr:ectoine synthase [Parvibaculum sp.]HUD53410.1 ectoine synthase [Parvibaculum sp.]
MLIRELDQTRASDRNVVTDGWESARLLLKDEGMGFSFHITTMYAGKELRMHYKNHLEAVFVLAGEGVIEDIGTGETHQLKPGVLYALNANDEHIVRPRTDIVTACVFNPPVTGREVHDESGAYPADVDIPAASFAS